MSEAPKEPPKRLESLDVLRGFDMFFIFLPDPAPCVCLVALAALGFGNSALAQQFDHVVGAGFHFYDLIFPLFLFMSGVTWPFSCASQRAKGASNGQLLLKILRRAALLVLLGSSIHTIIDGMQEVGWQQFDGARFRVWSVLGRIGIAWGVAAALAVWFRVRTRILITLAILLGMGYLTRFHLGWLHSLDINYLTTAHRVEGGVATVTMVATAMFGVFAGEVLHDGARTMAQKVMRLAGIAALLTGLGLFGATALGVWSLPIHKADWSSTYALFAGGLSFGLLALFYWIVDIKGWRRWGFFFKVIGMNAITIYVLMRTVLNYDFEKLYFFGGVMKFLSPAWGELVAQVGLIALGWLLLYYLYRKNIFLRV